MTLRPRFLAALLVAGLASIATAQQARTYDKVVVGGRVMDPATKLDAIRNIGILNGRIAAITTAPAELRNFSASASACCCGCVLAIKS